MVIKTEPIGWLRRTAVKAHETGSRILFDLSAGDRRCNFHIDVTDSKFILSVSPSTNFWMEEHRKYSATTTIPRDATLAEWNLAIGLIVGRHLERLDRYGPIPQVNIP